MAGAEVALARLYVPFLRGVWGFSHTRFGGPVEKIPIAAGKLVASLLNPGGSIVGDSWGNTSVFSRWSRAGPPQPLPDVTSGKKEQ